MDIRLTRRFTNDVCTIGDFNYPGQACTSMELPLKFEGEENVPDKTCIPANVYSVEQLFSAKHQRYMPHVMGVPERSAIEIHAASRPSDILGCIALGNNLVNQEPRSPDDVVINQSQEAFRQFEFEFENALQAGEKVTLTIVNGF